MAEDDRYRRDIARHSTAQIAVRTFTLFFLDPKRSPMLRAVTYDAETVERAIELVRVLDVREPCQLWVEGCYICSLKTPSANSRKWLVVSRDGALARSASAKRSAYPRNAS